MCELVRSRFANKRLKVALLTNWLHHVADNKFSCLTHDARSGQKQLNGRCCLSVRCVSHLLLVVLRANSFARYFWRFFRQSPLEAIR